ncbi:MAG: T9SS type A sorting domain-containing protein [Saprospiraceae bacterium]|nr:T9SS type A sorting domain-containing protein [Candidatus Opimibacter iunctus]
MKTLRYFFIICLMAAANLLSGQYALTLRCSGMTTYIGSPFHIRVIETATGDEVGRKTIASIMDDTLNIQLFVLLGGKDYQVDFYVDRNSNDTYEPPPTDHAWRRMVTNVSGPATIDFVPFVDYTDIAFPDIVYGYYDAAWGGLWKNLTFGSTDSIEAAFQVACDSIVFSFTTAGVFGNPDTVSFDFVVARPAEYNPVTDTLRFPVNPPWTGDAYVTNGEFHGNISLLNFSLLMTGTIGQKQLLSQYTVTDGGSPIANGYFYVKELEVINDFPPLELDLLGIPISCQGVNDGTLWVSVNGGTGNYEYAWLETGATTPYIEGLWADTFHVIVTDDLGCSVADSIILDVAGSVTIIDVYITNASCPGACDAVIEIDAIGGTLPFTYTIDSDSCTGFMTIYVTDAKGCIDSTEIFIFSDSNIEVLAISTNPSATGQSNGSVNVEVDGGIPPYMYSLDGISFQASPAFSGLPPGTYCVFISDANACLFKTDTFLIENSTGIREIPTNLKIYPNPASANLHVESDSPVSVDLLDLDGHVQRHSTSSRVFDIGVAAFPRGMYFLRVSDGAGYLFQKIILN